MTFFSDEDRSRIAATITAAEEQTSGEIVAVVTRESDNYRFIAVLWAAMAALGIPLVLLAFPRLTGWYFSFQPELLYALQLAVFIVLAILFQLQPARYFLAPGVVMRERAHRNAVEQFVAQDLHTTSGRTGVLIFVSIAERYAEVIADTGIYEKVDRDVWSDAVDILIDEIGAGRPAEGFVRAIEKCGGVLAEHFPPGSEESDALPNHLIELN